MQLGFVFLVLSKLGHRHFLTIGSGMGFPPACLVQHPNGLRGPDLVGLHHHTDHAEVSLLPPDTTRRLNSSSNLRRRHNTDLYLTCSIKPVLRHCPRNAQRFALMNEPHCFLYPAEVCVIAEASQLLDEQAPRILDLPAG